jgi:type IV pilus assembly protein PilN
MDINLLPWREEIIEYNKKIFTRLILAALVLAGVVLILVYNLFFGRVTYETSYAQALEKAKLNLVGNVTAYFSQQKLQKEINARYLMLQRLQYSRFETVSLLNEIAKVTPKGIYLNKLIRKDDRVELSGVANSNLLIANMMQSIEKSKQLKTISLEKVEKKQGDNSSVTEFDLKLALTIPTSLSQESSKKAETLELQNPITVIQQKRDEQNKKMDDAIKK